MGVGTPDDLLEAVARGIDMFDCVMPTRNGRHGMAFSRFGQIAIRNARHADDPRPLDEASSCAAAREYSRAYLHHLIKANEMLGLMLLSIINLSYYQELMQGMRDAIEAGRFDDFAPRHRKGGREETFRRAETPHSTIPRQHAKKDQEHLYKKVGNDQVRETPKTRDPSALSCRALGAAAVAMALSALPMAASSAQAQTYPNRPVRVTLPFAAGGVADATARVVAEKLGDKLGQRFVVENQPGPGGMAAARTALSGPPDGYILAMLTNGTAVSVPLFKSLSFDPLKDFTPISNLGNFDFIFATGADSGFKSLADILKAARASRAALTSAPSPSAAPRTSRPNC